MKVAIPQLNLAALIARGGATSAKKSPLMILNFVRLTAADGTLALASTDQDRFAEATGGATVETPGAVCVDAAALETLINKHPKNGMITLTAEDGRLTVTCGRSKVRLPTLPADDFPKWADQASDAEFSLPWIDFERAMGRVRHAASTVETRYYLQGVHLDAHDGSLHFVATDGHRLAVSGMAAPAGAEKCPKVIVPSEGVDAALKVFKAVDKLDIAVNSRAISFSADNLRLSSRLIEATYPEYTRIIPARGGSGVTFKRADFVDCLDRANVLTGEGAFSSIIARPDGETLFLESRNQNGGDATEQLAAQCDEDFQPFGFNPRYAAQFLSTLNVTALTIEQTGPDAPHLIYSDDAPDFIGVLSPMKVAA